LPSAGGADSKKQFRESAHHCGRDIINYLLVALGAALGAAARYSLGNWSQTLAGKPDFPLGTFVVNVSGAFLSGMAFSISGGWPIPAGSWQLVAVGVLGGYTTFSTFALDTLELLAEGKYGMVLLNLLTGPAGLLAVYLGVVFGRSLV
jgi:CrcB protein